MVIKTNDSLCRNSIIRVPLVEQELNSPPVFSGVRVSRSLLLCAMICRLLFVLLSLYIRPLCCLSFLYLRILIDPLVSSNAFYAYSNVCIMKNSYIMC